MATVWGPKSTSITLSGGNLVATCTANISAVEATRGCSGKTYWEIAVTTQSALVSIGICFLVTSFGTGTHLGEDGNHVGYRTDGLVRLNGSTLATIMTYAQGDVISVACDPANKLLWFRKNGGNWNNSATADPATLSEGIFYGTTSLPIVGFAVPAVTMAGATPNQAVTATFTAPFTHTAPSGFSSIDSVQSAGVGGKKTLSSSSLAIIGGGISHSGFYQIPGKMWSPVGHKYVSGVVRDSGLFVSRVVRAYDRATGEFLGETKSSPVDGSFVLDGCGRSEVFVVAFDDNNAPDYNAIIYDRVVPA